MTTADENRVRAPLVARAATAAAAVLQRSLWWWQAAPRCAAAAARNAWRQRRYEQLSAANLRATRTSDRKVNSLRISVA